MNRFKALFKTTGDFVSGGLKLARNWFAVALQFRSASFKNFIIFTAVYAALNLSARYFLLTNFFDNSNVFTIYWLITVVSACSLISIFIFYLKLHYVHRIKAFLQRFIDINRISQNDKKKVEIMRLVERDFGVSFKYLFVTPFIISAYIISSRTQSGAFVLLTVSIMLCYLRYLLKLNHALRLVEIPNHLLLEPTKLSIALWSAWLQITGWLSELFFARKPKAINPALKAAENSSRNFLNPQTIAWVFVTGVGGVSGSYYLIENDYTTRGGVSPITRSANLRSWGFESDHLETLQHGWELSIKGCDMKTFCIPGTSTLDKRAVMAAWEAMQHGLQNGVIVNRDVEPPKGPHISVFEERKECSFEKQAEDPFAPTE